MSQNGQARNPENEQALNVPDGFHCAMFFVGTVSRYGRCGGRQMVIGWPHIQLMEQYVLGIQRVIGPQKFIQSVALCLRLPSAGLGTVASWPSGMPATLY